MTNHTDHIENALKARETALNILRRRAAIRTNPETGELEVTAFTVTDRAEYREHLETFAAAAVLTIDEAHAELLETVGPTR